MHGYKNSLNIVGRRHTYSIIGERNVLQVKIKRGKILVLYSDIIKKINDKSSDKSFLPKLSDYIPNQFSFVYSSNRYLKYLV